MKYLRFSCLCSPLGLQWYHDLYLNLLSTLNLFLCMVYVGAQVSFFCMQLSSSPNTICSRGYFYSILCQCPLCQNLIDRRDLGLFLSSLFCSIGLFFCFMPVPGCFDYSGLVIQFCIRYCDPSYFALLSQNFSNYLGSLMVPYKFLKCYYYICEI